MIRRPLYRLTIRGKLVAIVMIVTAAVLVLCIVSFVAWDYGQFRRDTLRELTTQARMVLENSTAAMSFQDRAAAKETLETLAPNVHIRIACLYDASGVRFADSQLQPEAAACPERPPSFSASFGADRLEVVEHAVVAGRPAGSVYLRSDLDALTRRLRAQAIMAGILLLLALATAFVLSTALQRIISEPVHRLAETARRVERGDHSLRAEKTTGDELGVLVDAFNGMLDEMQRSERERASLLRSEREANRLKDEFLMTLSHELRTPLNAVLGWTRMLSAGVLPKDSAAKALEKIERNAQAQARLVDDLLQVSRLTTGKFQLHTEAVDLAAIVRHAIDAIKSQADARQIAIITIGDAGPLPTAGDADRLQQVFWNILANAVKFSPVGSNVTISLRRDAGFDVVDIADEGIGIEPDFLPHVFDPFRQADASSTREHGGLGLGLSIVRRITDLHGGGVAARSAGRGRGATFTVTLPVRTSDQIAPAAEPRLTPPPPSALANTNVLVVDDNADAREILMALLGAAGAHARAASSVVEAMAHVDALPPDVVVTDIAMPDHDGYELLRRLRGEFGEAGPIVAIALTAHASEQERDRALAAGFQRHIVKPFDPASLVRTIEELVEKSKYSRNV